jgi:hypothetical protein
MAMALYTMSDVRLWDGGGGGDGGKRKRSGGGGPPHKIAMVRWERDSGRPIRRLGRAQSVESIKWIPTRGSSMKK